VAGQQVDGKVVVCSRHPLNPPDWTQTAQA
jgi:hypothetical protein